MSEEKTGAHSPNRPETNVESNAADATSGNDGKAKRRRRRRGRNRKRKDVQADNATASPENGTEASQQPRAENAQCSGASENTNRDTNKEETIGADKGGKRARRRGRRRGKKPADENQLTGDAQQSTEPRNRRSVRRNDERRKNRNKPRQGENNGADTASKQHQHRPSKAYAALDLGTNNCRLLVAVPQQPGRFRVIDAFSRIVRLGEGLAGTGRLNNHAMDRAVEALKACADKLSNRSMKGVRLIATEACRRAENGEEFLRRVEAEAGLKLEIVDRETEARLAVAGCASLVDRKAKGAVLFDIGGGSSELALLDLRKRRRHDLGSAMVSWTSMPVGVVTLSERHGGGKLVTREIFQDMVEEVSQMLQAFEGRDSLQEAGSEGEVHLLGTSGTVTTLAGIHLKLPRYDRRQVDGVWMASQQVDAMIEALLEMTFDQRVQNPCIGQERADLVLAGCAILVAIQKHWPCPRLRVADRGLREGLLTEMMNRDNAWVRQPYRGKNPRNNPQRRP